MKCFWSTGHQVSLSVYWLYVKSMGVTLSCVMLAFFLLFEATSIYSNIWLSEWTSDPLLMNSTLCNTSEFVDRQKSFLGVYAALGGAQGTAVIPVQVRHVCLSRPQVIHHKHV